MAGTRTQLRVQGGVSVLLLLAVVGLLGYLSHTYHQRLDWTAGGRNSLSDASRKVLQGLEGEVRAIAFAREDDQLRTRIRELLARYQAAYPELALRFVNPDAQPALVREYAIRTDGTLVLERAGRRERLEQLDEQSVTNALLRLGRGGERTLAVLAGHGERPLQGDAPQGVGNLAAALRDQGIGVHEVTLAPGSVLPQGETLVLTSPEVALQPGEVQALRAYLEGGGNALVLLDPGPAHGLDGVLEPVGARLLPGTAVDPVGQVYTGNAGFVLATAADYQPHAALRGFEFSTVFVLAGALTAVPTPRWEAAPLIQAGSTGWLETGPLGEGAVRQDEGDTAGPLTLAYAFTRPREDGEGEQRVVVVADGDFLSNAYLGQGGNLNLGLNLVNWLAGDEGFVNVPARTASDIRLDLSRNAQLAVGFGWLFGVPLLLIAGALAVWLRRRRA
jgi:ABC-type uncharacterized transport system involved in gliding motility auxiliary subunit